MGYSFDNDDLEYLEYSFDNDIYKYLGHLSNNGNQLQPIAPNRPILSTPESPR
jgi:hypothetical protein